MTEYLTLEDLLSLCRDLGDLIVRDAGLLHAAAERPATTLYGEEVYVTLPAKAGALLHSIARNHALVDGNKRLAWLATVVFCELNGSVLDAPDDDAFDLMIAVSTGSIDATGVAAAVAPWFRPAGASPSPDASSLDAS